MAMMPATAPASKVAAIGRIPSFFIYRNPSHNSNPLPFLKRRRQVRSLRFPISCDAAAASAAAAASTASSTALEVAAAAFEGRGSLFGPPMAAAIAALARWLGLYREVLLVRVLLTWFPNLPWQKQPFSALRDLCDPYLALFRDILPPIFGKMDVSPLLAFAALEFAVSLLRTHPAAI